MKKQFFRISLLIFHFVLALVAALCFLVAQLVSYGLLALLYFIMGAILIGADTKFFKRLFWYGGLPIGLIGVWDVLTSFNADSTPSYFRMPLMDQVVLLSVTIVLPLILDGVYLAFIRKE